LSLFKIGRWMKPATQVTSAYHSRNTEGDGWCNRFSVAIFNKPTNKCTQYIKLNKNFKSKYTAISGFCHEMDENCAVVGYYAASNGNSIPTFRENLSVASSRSKNLGLFSILIYYVYFIVCLSWLMYGI
jgi:hypothetical protein